LVSFVPPPGCAEENASAPPKSPSPPSSVLVHAEGVFAMKQLSPGVGWAKVGQRLFWTSDNGSSWNDITPPSSQTQALYSPIFLDSLPGWVIVSVGLGNQLFKVARTDDGGGSWKYFDFPISSFEDLKNSIAVPWTLRFSDSQHGWLQWKVQTSSAFSVGRLFRTEDGGATWTELAIPPSAGDFRFDTTQEGWMTGGAASSELWKSYDGGQTWVKIMVPKPAGCDSCRPIYSIPAVRTPSDLDVSVGFSDDTAVRDRYVYATYASQDGGNSWRVTEQHDRADSKTELISHVGTDIVHVSSDVKHGTEIETGSTTTRAQFPQDVPRRGSIAAVDFVDQTNGWLVYEAIGCYKFRIPDGLAHPAYPSTKPSEQGAKEGTTGQQMATCVDGATRNDLLTTNDGGKTFQVITPGPRRQFLDAHTLHLDAHTTR
jgi:photosystem II stability/assembly factor-like uncharacterized protein